jgi:membrane-bound lytic murein transglycosylase B
MPLDLRRRLVLGGAAWLLVGAVDAAPGKRKRSAVKAVALVDEDASDAPGYGARDDVLRFADAVAERRALDPGWMRRSLAQARFQPLVTRYIMPSANGAAKNWAAYRARFVEPVRIRAGGTFWRSNEAWLRLADERYGVPAEIVVGIVGVETIFGRQMGNFRVIDALATLAFDFPAGRKDRSAFFQDELESWFVLCERERLDPLEWRGSYAGAFGMPQFMPSSFNRFAVDFDGDGHVDLHGNAGDVIGSVANYLAEFGWKRGLPVRFDAEPPSELVDRAVLLAPDIVPTFSATEMIARGARLPDEAQGVDSLLALVELQNGDAAPSYVAGTSNFYALTRYNWSSYYAMAVLSLGEAVRATLR